MTVFAILAATENPSLQKAVQEAFPDNHFKITPTQWLVAASGLTTEEVAQKLGVPGGGRGQVVIFLIGNYWGWHRNEIWEWLKTRWGQ